MVDRSSVGSAGQTMARRAISAILKKDATIGEDYLLLSDPGSSCTVVDLRDRTVLKLYRGRDKNQRPLLKDPVEKFHQECGIYDLFRREGLRLSGIAVPALLDSGECTPESGYFGWLHLERLDNDPTPDERKNFGSAQWMQFYQEFGALLALWRTTFSGVSSEILRIAGGVPKYLHTLQRLCAYDPDPETCVIAQFLERKFHEVCAVEGLAPVHGDMNGGNIFSDDSGHITGIIDLADVALDLPARDFLYLLLKEDRVPLETALTASEDAGGKRPSAASLALVKALGALYFSIYFRDVIADVSGADRYRAVLTGTLNDLGFQKKEGVERYVKNF